MTRKKIVFVIVEGPSDDEALGVLFSRLYDKNTVHVEITHGDITTDFKIAPRDIAKALGNLVKAYAKSNPFSRNDFQQVIHLIDMDGAYIPDAAIRYHPEAAIRYHPEAGKPVYSLTEIKTVRPEQLALRNQHKREKLARIRSLTKIWGTIPYQAYYMSRNLDHVLYGKLNSSDQEKEADAHAFAKKYREDIDGFLAFLSDSDFSRMDGYLESWDFIKKGLHSLERFTNLGLCFAKIREERRLHLSLSAKNER